MIKSFTSLEQSKKLAEILPLESADYHYIVQGEKSYFYPYSLSSDTVKHYDEEIKYIPCWSLATLLDVLPNGTDIVKEKADTENEKYMCTVGYKSDILSTFGNNPVDACVAMIEKVHEQKNYYKYV